MRRIKKVVDLGFDYKEDYKYPLFLLALLSFFFLPSFFPRRIEVVLDSLFFIGLIVTSILLMESKSKIKRGVVIIAGILGIIVQITDIFMVTPRQFKAMGFIFLFIMFVILLQELLIQIFNSKKITLNVVMGAFTGYILIGIIGFCVILMVYLFNPESYKISETAINDLLYYSFITLSTIGYGDISPLSIPAKNIAVIIGLVGQFYNAIIMAAIIGKFLQAKTD
jgi:voltage-gated potassium channel